MFGSFTANGYPHWDPHWSVIYLQCVYNDATVSSWLVGLKCKVAPCKSMTVPWSELAGDVLGLRLTQHLTLVLVLPMQSVTFCSDSMDVLWWIRVMARAFIYLWLIVSERSNCDWAIAVTTFTDRGKSSWSVHKGSSTRRAIRELTLVAWTKVATVRG